MTTVTLIDNICTSLRKNFPLAKISASPVRTGLGDDLYFTVQFGLIGDINELQSRIDLNDPAGHKFMVFIGEGGAFEASALRSGISINPTEKFYAMSTVKTKFRKTVGDDKAILRAFVRFSDRLVGLVKENDAEIYQRSKYSDKYFELS
ncbi:hypothetical protein GD1_67 [Paraglaciecola Antarctic GD virus 1]|nr:hypothetical protein GD1_67 [Paraglaciecola Antarctic GD virus 1]